MFGPHGTSAQPTLTPLPIACLIVGVSGPPSFGPMNQAWYLFETSASRSWFTWTFVVNFASNTVSLTLGYLAATFFAPSSSASQYVLAAEARNTPMLIVPALLLPDAVDPSVAAVATKTTVRTPATSAFLIPWPPWFSGSHRAFGIPAAANLKHAPKPVNPARQGTARALLHRPSALSLRSRC